MSTDSCSDNSKWLPREQLQDLIAVLQQAGYEVIGPRVRDGAIVYDPIDDASQLPTGWNDTQAPALYRLEPDSHGRQFFFNASPDSWKKYLYPARQELSGARLTAAGWEFATAVTEPPKRALLGVRACDLAAIAVQDRVFLNDDYVDPVYAGRREATLIIAVQCSTAAATCFCTSMGTGPECDAGFDILLTETDDGFCLETGSDAGQRLIAAMDLRPADSDQQSSAAREVEQAREAVTKHFNNQGVHDLLLQNLQHPRWSEVAQRCLSCTNCTMVCPTCFCSTVEEVSDLDQTEVTRVRQWDSCFNVDFSYTAGGVIRNDIRSRYRQWLTHKLATWYDQFDTSGCVGCGRCITWCPVGIDLTEEVAAIRDNPQTELPIDGDHGPQK